jgi:dihydroflavonol-4-reductase
LSSKILVTGGTGFVGSYIIKLLVEKNYEVRALRRSSNLPFYISPGIFEKVEWIDGDILDVISLQDALEDVKAVIHSAAIVSFTERDRKKMYQVNVDGTANVVNICLEKNVSRLIHISSVAAVGRTAGGGEVNEEKQWEDSSVNTHYARSKFKAELEVWRGAGEGLSTIILNPSTVLGYGDWNTGSSRIFKNIFEEFPWYTSGINGFVDVEDVARVVDLLLHSHITEERFIVNGATWSFKQLMDTIARHFGKKPPSRQTSEFMMTLAWRMEKLKSFFTGKDPLLTKESAKVAMSKTWFLSDKLLAALPGFSFTPLEKTIQNSCENYMKGLKMLQP